MEYENNHKVLAMAKIPKILFKADCLLFKNTNKPKAASNIEITKEGAGYKFISPTSLLLKNLHFSRIQLSAISVFSQKKKTQNHF